MRLPVPKPSQDVSVQGINAPNSRISSLSTRRTKFVQSSTAECRNKRAVGYHGLSSRPSSHRQSCGLNGSNIHTGLPIAPAKWATLVSTVTTMSTSSISDAVSAKSPRSPGVIGLRCRGSRTRVESVTTPRSRVGHVVAVDLIDQKLELPRELGAEYTVNAVD